jgi:hypothetical protein
MALSEKWELATTCNYVHFLKKLWTNIHVDGSVKDYKPKLQIGFHFPFRLKFFQNINKTVIMQSLGLLEN